MNLEKKKQLVSRTLRVGKSRIIFNNERLTEIKEAITKQDVRDLVADKAIFIREIKGRMKKPKRTTRRRMGSRRKVFRNKKKDYVALTRKLRAHVRGLRREEKISKEQYKELRKAIRSKTFKSKSHLQEYTSQ